MILNESKAGRMSSRLLVFLIFALVFVHSDLFLKITKIARLLLADDIKIKKIMKENH